MRLKIGAHTYEIIPTSTEHFEDCGKVDREKYKIYINENLHGTEYLATLIHEALHVWNNELSHTDIEFLAQAFTQLIVENPHAFTPRKKN